MQLPLQLVRTGHEALQESGETKNLSSGGVLFCAKAVLNVGDLIEYEIVLPAHNPPVVLHCKGKVLRHQAINGKGTQQIAATLERYEFIRNR